MTPETLYAVIEATWPSASVRQVGPFLIRTGLGGGSRVSAATITAPVTAADLPQAEAEMEALGQPKIFMIRAGDDALDALLEAEGYVIKDPVVGFVAPVSALTAQRPPPVSTFEVWPPLAVQREIWAAGGIGPARLAVMDRVTGPKTTILGRVDDTPAGCAFVACHGPHAMLHALETSGLHRRKGVAARMLTACAFWAKGQGAETFSLVVTQANTGAHALYASLGMEPVGQYHYRIKTDAKDDPATLRC
ncbi:GNAT family N-acetyltransferase [Flavimaricola marinus]|uniref:Acetyltransferase (GNAT) family protein n=1 Tax=Flavimaricola marinus TaxID=1819565 RepID=A0A238LG66_9RHOB|nr:GNAT family N-acetyltransferase [Flavimaricola marinus]SMY08414.1 Acetyltransferase (GNAT) family protein [Flavimaricola marinus]